MSLALSVLLVLSFVAGSQSFCGDSIRWSHQVNIEDVFGMWYGVGYAQHTPDMTSIPNEVGCVTLFITDVSGEPQNDWLDWSIIHRNYSDDKWRSYKSHPWSNDAMSGSWLDIRLKRQIQQLPQDINNEKRLKKSWDKDKKVLKRRGKRNMYDERRIRVMWDEDGQTLEQIYVYTPSEPGLWVAEQRNPLEREMIARGIDVWYADDPPRHPQVIRVLKVTPHMMIINHCSELGDGGIFSLILRRSPSRMARSEWYDYQRDFFSFELPKMYRYFAICKGCDGRSSVVVVLLFSCLILFFNMFINVSGNYI